MQTRDQKLAIAVYEKVNKHSEKSKADRDKYGTMARKLPVLILTTGLAQSISFLEAKSKKDSEKMNKQLLEDLAASLDKRSDDFADACRKAGLIEYLQLTQNTLAALLWFKRFSVSVLEVEENASVE